jgi:lysozyme family protein
MPNEESVEEVFQNIIKKTLRDEGVLSDHSADRGGLTKYGITKPTLSRYLGRPAKNADILLLTEDQAIDVYRQLFWKQPNICTLWRWPLVARSVFDFAVHSGCEKAVAVLQSIVGANDDGVLGAKTHMDTGRYISQMGEQFLTKRYLLERGRFLMRLIVRDKSQHVFAEGWFKRIARQLMDV